MGSAAHHRPVGALLRGLLPHRAGTVTGRLSMAAFMLGWAGLSVHCQVLAFLGDSGLSLRTYLTGKLLHGGLSALFHCPAGPPLPLEAPVSSYLAEQVEGIASLDFQRALTISTAAAWGVWLLFCGTGRLYGEKKQWKTQAKESIMVPTTHWEGPSWACFKKRSNPCCTYCARGRAPERGSGDLRPEGGHVCRFQMPILQVRPIETGPPRPAKADFSRLKDEDFVL